MVAPKTFTAGTVQGKSSLRKRLIVYDVPNYVFRILTTVLIHSKGYNSTSLFLLISVPWLVHGECLFLKYYFYFLFLPNHGMSSVWFCVRNQIYFIYVTIFKLCCFISACSEFKSCCMLVIGCFLLTLVVMYIYIFM